MRRAKVVTVMGALIGAPVMFLTLALNDVFVRDVWTREHPLVQPIAVSSVLDGVIVLNDGRAFRPAGIRRSDRVSILEFDRAVWAAVQQGITVVQDLGDGRAFLTVEPKFYNWCGTHGIWTRWLGRYVQCPLSELLIYTNYASENSEEPGLTDYQRWRLEGTRLIDSRDAEPRMLSPDATAFRIESGEERLSDLDVWVELMWKPPPPPG
jgi:hypothetical protein